LVALFLKKRSNEIRRVLSIKVAKRKREKEKKEMEKKRKKGALIMEHVCFVLIVS
jgi:hypothetical protein